MTWIGDSRRGSTECQGFIGECTVCTVRYERQACTMTALDDPMQPSRVGKHWAVLKPELKFAMLDKQSLNTHPPVYATYIYHILDIAQ